MPAKAAALGDGLDRSLSRLIRTSRSVLGLGDTGQLAVREVEDALGGIAVLAHAEVEGFIDRLFTGLLAGAVLPANSTRIHPLIRAKSYTHAREIVLGRTGGNDYVTWLPYSSTVDHAQRLFRSGRPFTSLDPTAAGALQQLHVVRNALAHSSSRAARRFHVECVGTRPLPPWQRRPAGFLRGIHTGTTTRLEYFLIEMRDAFVSLASL